MRFRLDADPEFSSEDPQDVFRAYYSRLSDGALMLASWDAPWRAHIVDAVSKLPTLTSLYEIGCGAGPNLRRLQQAAPHLRLGGCDFAETLVAHAAAYGDVTVQSVPCKVGPEWDATLSCYALAYLDLHQMETALQQIESRYLILAEPMTEGYCEFVVPLDGGLPAWLHDYAWFLARTGWHLLWSFDLPERVDLLNRILIAERGA